MLKAFRKLISQTPDLNEVQQNVFDTVKEIQQVPLAQVYNFGDVVDVENDTFVDVGVPIALEEGNYCLEIGCLGVVEFSSPPTWANVSARVVLVDSSLSPLVVPGSAPVVLGSATNYRGFYLDVFGYETKGAKILLQAAVATSGGTISSRTIDRPFLKIQRRSL